MRHVDGAYELTGVVSWGVGGAEPKKPSLYTGVCDFLDWIRETAGEPQY